jgi:mannan endo-1,4-beta-mannosidase
MAGYVAKDKSGPVPEADTAPSSRWAHTFFEKKSPFLLSPDLSDTNVYIDEYVNFLVNKYGTAGTSTGIMGYSLDNEPSLWPSTHPRIHPHKTLCKEIIDKSIALSKAVKNIDPYAEIFGPALYGFNAYQTFQDAPDWNSVKTGKNYSWFIDYYLDKMKEAEDTTGKRLLDVLDVHWYPEALGSDNIRITDNNANSLADQLARVQAPRTLWDKSYIENSWIGTWGKAHLPIIPNLINSINKYYPGTKLAFTEFTYGGENDITGAIAMDDVLGIFGKYGVYFGTFWQTNSPSDYISAAYKVYRNYDGSNATAGNYYLPSQTSDSVNCSIYGSIDPGKNEIHLIVINKNFNESVKGNFNLTSSKKILSGRVWILDSGGPEVREISPVDSIINNSFSHLLPSESVCHFVLKTSNVVSVRENERVPENFYLKVFPNPFNPSCKIEYSISQNKNARIDIFSVTGKLIRSFKHLAPAGYVNWNGENENNNSSAAGVYLAVLRNGYRIAVQKLILLK